MSLNSDSERRASLLLHEFEQSALGTIIDAQLLTCHFKDDVEEDEEWMNEDYKDIAYSKYIRKHSKILGKDMIVAISEYGKLVFMTIIHNDEIKRFETVTEVQISLIDLYML